MTLLPLMCAHFRLQHRCHLQAPVFLLALSHWTPQCILQVRDSS